MSCFHPALLALDALEALDALDAVVRTSMAAGVGIPNRPPRSRDVWPLRLLGDPVLSKPCDPAGRELTAENVVIARALAATCIEHGGAGLSAPQIGVSLRIFVARVGGKFETFCNPMLLGKSVELRAVAGEGCLSLPGFRTNTKRHLWVDVVWTAGPNPLGHRVARRFFGAEAQVVQHELDHLDGTLIVDGLSRQQRRAAERAVAKYRGSVA